MDFLKPLFFLTMWLYCIPTPTSASCTGCVELDHITFKKLIPKFPYALIKFDIAFPYGEKHEAFSQFSLQAHKVTNDLLLGLVGIKDYGEKENSDLGEKYGVDSEAYPEIFLFRGSGLDDYVKFPKGTEITVESLKEFVTQNTDLYIGLDGCIKEFNDIVEGYVDKDKDEQAKLLEKAQHLLESLDTSYKTNGKVYIAFMKKIFDKGIEFVKEENSRLNKLKSSKVSDTKKVELTHKLNILKSFKSKGSQPKSEL